MWTRTTPGQRATGTPGPRDDAPPGPGAVSRLVDVAVVGGGPAGAALAAALASGGHEVVLLERTPSYRWRACGVFSTPASLDELRALGVPRASLVEVARPIPAMRVESPGGTAFRLTYGDDGSGRATAVGFDRQGLDTRLLELAAESGVEVRRGVSVETVQRASNHGRSARTPGRARISFRGADGPGDLAARIVVGADGIRSRVARELGVTRSPWLPARVGLTCHIEEIPGGPHPDVRVTGDARMVIFKGGYCGVAPVPGARLNIGIVIGAQHVRRELARTGADAIAERIVAGLPPAAGQPWALDPRRRTDRIVGASPVGHRVSRMTGSGWLLVGDAAGFLDPFTGEGIHRALVSARLGAEAVDAELRGTKPNPLPTYERAMRERFRPKDVLGWLIQLFVSRPWLFDRAARRLAARDRLRETMSLVMADLVPAGRALNARYLTALLAP